ncbi:beta-taxilin-like [Hippocampus zosterae]|uniref:beta-taxilin-like n=1 Tax=Hippocampus zosterae TaxID=109293 RepID=UPI00223DE09F|nr:beta-taxilin-like [Hippocampus zosterae]
MWAEPVGLFWAFSCRLHLAPRPRRGHLRRLRVLARAPAEMETSAPRPQDEGAPPSAARDLTEEFGRRLQEIVGGNAQVAADAHRDPAASDQSEASCVMDGLSAWTTSEEKLEHLMSKHAELLVRERGQQKEMEALRDDVCTLRAERGQLERLCRDVQDHCSALRDEGLRRRREDEGKRAEMAAHFQSSLAEIQTQIEQHSARNEKLCEDNAKLSQKLHSLLEQCQRREESLEKMDRHRDLQQQLTSAKLEQANALLADAQQKHRREKEYLLAETVDKTRKCFAMKEEELSMKKKLALYSKKFDEFQTTLAKSNEIYARFKAEMEQMSEKMKRLEKESDVWKSRFENCNKALTDLLEERIEKGKEYEVFVATIRKLEKLCRALQDERKVLYAKIKDVRLYDAETSPEAAPAPEKHHDHDNDDDMTEEMRRLEAEQVKLREFAESLNASRGEAQDRREGALDPEERPEERSDHRPLTAASGHFNATFRPSEPDRPSQAEAEVEPAHAPAEAEADVEPEVNGETPAGGKAEPSSKSEAKETVKAGADSGSSSEVEALTSTVGAEDPVGSEATPPALGHQPKKESKKNKKRRNAGKL